MSIFADTSFLCALYRREEGHTDRADEFMARQRQPLYVSNLVLLEFRQSARFQAFRFLRDRTPGYPMDEADRMIRLLDQNIGAGALRVAAVEWPAVHDLTEKLSREHTYRSGARLLDLMHVATALHLGGREFLTFDSQQGKIAKMAGLGVRP